jgi:ADP-heptose:LPS heptosyltransferase
MAEKHLYFCNILVSRWVNALGSPGARLQFSLRSGMDHSVVSSNDQALGDSVSGANHSGVGLSAVPMNAHSSQESNSSTLKNPSLGQPNGQGSMIPKLPIKSILVVKWDEIGDMAAAVHVFGTLKSAYPDAKLTVLCKPFVASLIAGDPAVDEVITDIEDWQERYDVVVELRGTWKTLWKSLALRTMPKYRVDRGWVRFLQRGDQPHELVTNERIIRPLLGEGQPIAKRVLHPSAEEIAQAQVWSDWALSGEGSAEVNSSNNLSAGVQLNSSISPSEGEKVDSSFNQSPGEKTNTTEFAGYAILHTGARRELRRWPLDRFVALSKWLLQEKKLIPIWVGTSDEEHQLDEAVVLGATGKKWVAPEGSSLLAFYAFIASSKLYVGNESGPLQLADIAGIPLVAIYGPGVPNVFYPRSARSRVLHEVLDCNPCDQIHCVRPSDRCIDRIGLAAVQLAVNEVLG